MLYSDHKLGRHITAISPFSLPLGKIDEVALSRPPLQQINCFYLTFWYVVEISQLPLRRSTRKTQVPVRSRSNF